MADQDTDRWVLEVLAPDLRKKMKELNARKELEWNLIV
jgi:pyridoxal phosphate phosphatase PHOSPHO2